MIRLFFFLGILFFNFACSKPSEPIKVEQSKTSEMVKVPSEFGNLKGHVQIEGKVPKSSIINISADPECQKIHGQSKISSQNILVKDQRLQNAFVYIKEGLPHKNYPSPKNVITIDQKGCQYNPRISGVMINQPVEILNSDALLHNVHGKSKGKSMFNFAMPTAGQKRKQRFKEPQIMVHLKCDVHPWMSAYLGVLDHPFFHVTGSDGSFSFQKIPEGDYTLAVWHERLGSRELQVKVLANKDASTAFIFKPTE